MPSVRYMNQSAPFWDFVAGLEDQRPARPAHPHANTAAPSSSDSDHPWASWGWGPPPHHGGGGGPAHHPREGHTPPAPPPPADGDDGPPAPPEHEAGPPSPPPPPRSPHHGGPPHHEGPPHHDGPAHHHHHNQHHRRRGCGCGPRRGGRGAHRGWHDHGAWGMPAHGANLPGGLDMRGLAELFGAALFGPGSSSSSSGGGDGGATTDAGAGAGAAPPRSNDDDDDDDGDDADADVFRPEADVFDTRAAFVVHVSVAGARREDVGVQWDAERGELRVAGVVRRPLGGAGDGASEAEMLGCLALAERRVGAFERRVRLGSRAGPASVDAEGISARLEDGVLRVEVPKMEGGFVEIRRVDVE